MGNGGEVCSECYAVCAKMSDECRERCKSSVGKCEKSMWRCMIIDGWYVWEKFKKI